MSLPKAANIMLRMVALLAFVFPLAVLYSVCVTHSKSLTLSGCSAHLSGDQACAVQAIRQLGTTQWQHALYIRGGQKYINHWVPPAARILDVCNPGLRAAPHNPGIRKTLAIIIPARGPYSPNNSGNATLFAPSLYDGIINFL